MFNRTIQMKVTKTPKAKSENVNTNETECEGKTAIIAYTIDRGFRKIGAAVCAYVVLDTMRQVLIARAKNS